MSIPTLTITPAMAEMGMIDNSLIITGFSEDLGSLSLEMCIRTEGALSKKAAKDLGELIHPDVTIATTAFASAFHHLTRGGDLTVACSLGFYVMDEED